MRYLGPSSFDQSLLLLRMPSTCTSLYSMLHGSDVRSAAPCVLSTGQTTELANSVCFVLVRDAGSAAALSTTTAEVPLGRIMVANALLDCNEKGERGKGKRGRGWGRSTIHEVPFPPSTYIPSLTLTLLSVIFQCLAFLSSQQSRPLGATGLVWRAASRLYWPSLAQFHTN